MLRETATANLRTGGHCDFMKRIFLSGLSLFVAWASACAQGDTTPEAAVRAVVGRVFPDLEARLLVELSESREASGDYFCQELEAGKLRVRGSSPIALCRGVYDFIRNNGYGIVHWSGDRLDLPENLGLARTRKCVSPFRHHYYFNVVTYGYTLPYWDWARWEREIDWMALHGIDMPLALVANEAITARVWRRLGFTEEEIADYFVGPAHLPWMRMGNISGIDSPLPAEWHERQIALQHRILSRMRSLGMKPICPGFAGFVPQAVTRLFPKVKITETSWGGAFRNWMLSPEEPLFCEIGKLFIEEWEKEFGKNDYYLVDSFNEMEIPFPSHGNPERYALLADYGEKVYRSVKAGNRDAVWVMQGWMFGYQRNIWDPATLRALLSRVPDDRMLLLDLAVDYNRCFWKNGANWELYEGFFNKPWVYSVIPNMGGKSGMTGVLAFYANGHLSALNSANRGKLTAFGMAPEGLENNEVIYELIADAGWSSTAIDVEAWLENYTQCRYGSVPQGMKAFWQGMVQSVYGSFTDHPRYNWQLRPGMVGKGTINANAAFYRGIEALAEHAASMKGNVNFENDFCEWAVAYAGGKAEALTREIELAYAQGRREAADAAEKRFIGLLEKADQVLASHPTKSLEHWIRRARNCADGNEALADYYERNARRIVTIWGPPVEDYSARLWSGLIGTYYLPRWKHYFEMKKSGKSFDFPQWERAWIEPGNHISPAVKNPVESKLDAALELLRSASGI